MYRFFSIFERDSLWTTVDKSSRIAPLPLRVPHQSNNPNLAPANQSAGVLFYRDAYVGAMAEEVQTFRQSDSIILRHRAKNVSKGVIRKNCAADFPLRRCHRAATRDDQSLFRQRHMRSAVASTIRCEALSMSGGNEARKPSMHLPTFYADKPRQTAARASALMQAENWRDKARAARS